jgi:hypothetical protein
MLVDGAVEIGGIPRCDQDLQNMLRIVGSIIALVIFVVLALPFAHDAYHRYQVSRRLDALMDDRDRAAFRNWTGDASSFGRSLYERCELTYGKGAAACEPYLKAIQ